jgi:transcriptional regulator GlxA family with amidase domain
MTSRSGPGCTCRRRAPSTLINQKFDQPLSVEEIARHAGLSAYHFSRIFRRAIGRSPHAYLTARRVIAAKKLLAESDCSLGEVSVRCGYRQHSHFTGIFRRTVGMLPRQYRIAHRLPTRPILKRQRPPRQPGTRA